MIYLWCLKGVSYALHDGITIALDDCAVADDLVFDLMIKGKRLATKSEYQYSIKYTKEIWSDLLKVGNVV